VALFLPACAGQRTPSPPPAATVRNPPPAGLSAHKAPQFVCIGSDDNGVSGLPGSGAAGGMTFLTEQCAGRRNPAGAGRASGRGAVRRTAHAARISGR